MHLDHAPPPAGFLTLSRRAFLRRGAWLAAAAPLVGLKRRLVLGAPAPRTDAKVAIAPCRSYGAEVRGAFKQCFDLLGGVGSLVRGKTVTVKINLTGTNFMPFLGRPVGETYMTHYATAHTLAALLFEAGARRVRFVESTQSRARLETSLSLADWNLKALEGLGPVEFENTRNLGKGTRYVQLRVPSGGYLFSSFQFNQVYDETDVMVSLCKLKQHLTTAVTLSMKNLFGITPNSLYGDQAGSEEATGGRGPLHSSIGFEQIKLPGLSNPQPSPDPSRRVPRIVADICAARPIHLAVIDGITAMSGGEGPWCGDASSLRLTAPGVLIVGLNPVSADSVGAAVMGGTQPRAARGAASFGFCDNHLLLAEQAGLGTAELSRIEVLGVPLEKAVCPYPALPGTA